MLLLLAPHPCAGCDPWRWANPLPQGNALTALAVGDGRLVAVGLAGTIITSDDHGESWACRDAGLDEPIRDVAWTGTDFVAVSTRHILTSGDGESWHAFDPTPLFVAVGINWIAEGIELAAVASDGSIVIVAASSGTQLHRDASMQWRLDRVGVSPSLTRVVRGGGHWVGLAQRQGGTALYSSANGTRWTLRANGFWILSDLAWNGAGFLAVGTVTSGGDAVSVALTSSDGEDWSASLLLALGTEVLLRAVTWDGTRWVGVGSYGAFATSSDSTEWVAGDTGCGEELSRVVWSSHTLVAVGDYGTLLTSPDALAWTSRRSGPADWLFDVIATPQSFFAVGREGVVWRSVDGRAWQDTATGATETLLAIIWTGDRLVAVGRAGTIVSSPDGSVWTAHDAPTRADLLAVTWNGALVVAVGTGGTVVTSPDGLTWTSTVAVTSETLCAVAWGANRFIAVGSNGAVVTSADGLAWMALDTQTRQWLYGIAWNGATLVACGSTETVLTSSDGLTWSVSSGGLDAFLAITWDGARFTIVTDLGQTLTSSNGFAWTRERAVTANSLHGVASRGHTTVAVGAAGTVIRRECDRQPRLQRRLPRP